MRLEYVEKLNTSLAKQLLRAREDKQSVEAKLTKIVNLKELRSNFAAIEGNTFFSKDKANISSLSTNLLDSVKDQYQSSLKYSYVAKYAHLWLEKTRQRRYERQ